MVDDAGEAYQSLYRRYRPQRFGDVRGQEHVTTALRNAVRQDRVAHAYLFSGPRGTGKTSTARILAMALDCENPVDGEPDGTCPSCIAIRQGASMDVQELDAASNRKLDEMRDLLSRVALGTGGRWKVYIIDEVHQLTPDAASALLKTLEEPPAHVVFVLATTDPQKVLPTIRSRTQHYEFRLLSSDTLGGLLADVNRAAGLGVAPEAIDLVVRRGHGSARDALSVLDQVAAAGSVEDESSAVSDIVEGLAERDTAAVLVAVAEAMGGGREPRRLATELLEHLRNGFLAMTARGLLQLPDDAAAQVEGQARRLGLAGTVRALEVVGEAAAEMRDSVDPRVTLEVALVRVAAPALDTDSSALLARLDRLEAQVAGGVPARPAVGPPAPPGGAPAPVAAPGPAPVASASAPAPAGSSASSSSGADEAGRAQPPAAPAPGSSAADGPPAAVPRPRPSGRPPRDVPAPAPRPSLGAPPPVPPPPGRAVPQVPAAPTPGPAAPPGPPGGSRPTIGAHRREAAARPPGPPPQSAPAPVRPAAATPAADVGRTEPPPPTPSGHQPPPVPAAASAPPGPPSRDDLTKAWGDTVLPGLPGKVKAYLAQGRFVGVEGSRAVFALPDRGLLSRAGAVKADAEAALGAHFGQPVSLHLVLDDGATPATGDPEGGAGAPPPAEASDYDPTDFDYGELQDAGPGVMSPEQRLLEAFPGAEEVPQ